MRGGVTRTPSGGSQELKGGAAGRGGAGVPEVKGGWRWDNGEKGKGRAEPGSA